jgi:4-hydroxy-2-oxovalerate aldolase
MINIIENTLRDGSYLIDFQFDKEQTGSIANGLNALGFQFIEIGHGLGLGAGVKPEIGLAKESDANYIRAAKQAAPNAKIGVFFIPGIGTKEDIDLAVNEGIDFIRIGNNVDTYKEIHDYARYAKEKGLFVGINLMKSYGVKPYEFTKIVQDIDQWQIADVIYLVDSAGCMMPHEVYEYIDRTKEVINTKLGFHGHNNLSLAVANSLQAVQAGASFVDTCIRGMGRSAGNAQSEIMVPLLHKMGIAKMTSEIYDFYDFANQYIVPLMPKTQGLSDEEIHVGLSKFHTSFMKLAESASKEENVDKKVLIKKVSEINCVNPSKALFTEVAQKIKRVDDQ